MHVHKSNAYFVFGANTDVGKTCVSMGFAQACKGLKTSFAYLKPLQTGAQKVEDTDAYRLHAVAEKSSRIETLCSWLTPVSPHLASEAENLKISSAEVLKSVEAFLKQGKTGEICFVETAGGPASPASDGQLQAHIYRALLKPVILVGDSKLGGISTTITAFSFLQSCGYKIAAVILFQNELANEGPIADYCAPHQVPVFVVPQLTENIQVWLRESEPNFIKILNALRASQTVQNEIPTDAIAFAKQHFWWPFTQHKSLHDVNFIDAAIGDTFYTQQGPQFDANGSWWTQGLGHGDLGLAQSVSFAAARYGHVLFPQNVHEPALRVVEKLLTTVGQGWANRVFFSDNGSTAIEVALKMAFRYREKLRPDVSEWNVLGLADSYHGDTIAAMDASSPNEFKQSERWYKPRGVWLKAPTVHYENGALILDAHKIGVTEDVKFSVFGDVFSPQREHSSLAKIYLNYIEAELSNVDDKKLGALLIEPVVHGSGGMLLIDPLFQIVLVDWCREKRIPVIFDEVFTGLWRLGVPSAAHLLRRTPDIACYAKLLTGGILPLAVTVSSEHVFESFLGDSKAQALLHGHSYTAHPIGCMAAVHALARFEKNVTQNRVADYWNEVRVVELSQLPHVKRVTALGSILAVEFKLKQSGYLSQELSSFIESSKAAGFYFRPLGNVIYFVVSPLKTKTECSAILETFFKLCKEV